MAILAAHRRAWLPPALTREAFGELDGGEKYSDEVMMQGRDTTRVMRRERRRESRLTVRQAGIMRFSLEGVADAEFFNGPLKLLGIPRDHEPLIEILTPPSDDIVPVEAYGLGQAKVSTSAERRSQYGEVTSPYGERR